MTVRPPRRPGTLDDIRDLHKRVRILEALNYPFSGASRFETYRQCTLAQDDLLAYMPLADPVGSLTVEELVASRVTDVEYGPGSYPLFGEPGAFAGLPEETSPEFQNFGASSPFSDAQVTMDMSAADKAQSFGANHSWAVKMWVYRKGDQGNGQGFLFLNWTGSGSNASDGSVITSGANNFIQMTRGTTTIGAAGTTPIPLNTWTEVWFVYDGTNVAIYIDQVLAVSAASASTITAGDFLFVGNNNNVTGSGFRVFFGRIAHVQLYSGANLAPCVPAGFEGGPCGLPDQVPTSDGACGWSMAYPTLEIEGDRYDEVLLGGNMTIVDNGDGSATINSTTGTGTGDQLDYVERTTGLTITATSDATANTYISGNAVVYDGSTRILVEFLAPSGTITTGQALVVNLYDGATDLGRLTNIQAGGGTEATPLPGQRFLTPSAGSHTYHIKAWKTGGTASIDAGAGGVAAYMPAFYRITVA